MALSDAPRNSVKIKSNQNVLPLKKKRHQRFQITVRRGLMDATDVELVIMVLLPALECSVKKTRLQNVSLINNKIHQRTVLIGMMVATTAKYKMVEDLCVPKEAVLIEKNQDVPHLSHQRTVLNGMMDATHAVSMTMARLKTALRWHALDKETQAVWSTRLEESSQRSLIEIHQKDVLRGLMDVMFAVLRMARSLCAL